MATAPNPDLPPIPDDVPDAAEIERRHDRYYRRMTWALGLVITLDAIFIVHLFFGTGRELNGNIRWGWMLFGFGYWLWISLGFLIGDAVRLEKAGKDLLGPYSRKEAKKLLKELLKRFRDKETPNFYVRRSAEPGAACIDSIAMMNFLKPLNAFHVTSMLFHLLRPDELRSVLAHELAHFHRYMYPLRRGDVFVFLFAGLAVAEVGWLIGAESFFWSLLWGSAVWWTLIACFGHVVMHLGREQEYLCDLFGARQTDKLSAINALLQLGKGLEVSERVFEKILPRIADDPRMPIGALGLIVGIVDKHLPHRLLKVGEEDPMLDEAFASEDMEILRKDLDKSEREKKEKQLKELLKHYENKPGYKLLDWSAFDFAPRDLRVNEVEYPHLLRRLLDEPEGQLVNFTYDNVKDAGNDVHPTLRQRILFLEKNYGSEAVRRNPM